MSQALKTAPVLLEVWRGPLIESQHRGHIAIMAGNGRLVASIGDPQTRCFFRSSAKPFQSIPLVESGAAQHFGFTPVEIALSCASHSGQDFHIATASSMLRKAGLSPDQLHCGTHWPFNKSAAEALLLSGQRPNPLHNNCSGKHAGMLALASFLKTDLGTYEKEQHPIQQAILRAITKYCGEDNVVSAMDGCSVPTFGVSLAGMARAFCQLAIEQGQIVRAMQAHPEMVGGTGELDTELMRISRNQLVSKGGAETLYCGAILPNDQWPKGLGIALKIEDGQSTRSRGPVAIEILRQLEVLTTEQIAELGGFRGGPITNHRGTVVGELRPAFTLRARK